MLFSCDSYEKAHSMAPRQKLVLSLDQQTIDADQKKRREQALQTLHPIFRFWKPSRFAAPLGTGIATAEQFELSASSLEAGVAALRAPPGVVVQRDAWHRSRRVRSVAATVALGLVWLAVW